MATKISAISPRTNAFMTEEKPATPEAGVFDRVFSDMAYAMLEGQFPDLLAGVVTFKILETSVEEGTGVGVFIVDANGAHIYVPIILTGNAIKAPELFYHKGLDAFFPLTKDWVMSTASENPDEMGEGVEPPKTLPTDVNTDNITLPPYTGRFSYASASVVDGPDLEDFFGKVGNAPKLAFAKLLRENRPCLEAALKHYGDNLVPMLRTSPEKVAEVSRSWWVLGPDAAKDLYLDAFGKAASLAYQTALNNGIVVRDTRKTAAVPVDTDAALGDNPTEPSTSGVYKIVDTAGKVSTVAIFSAPSAAATSMPKGMSREHRKSYLKNAVDKFLVVFPDGKYFTTNKLIALETSEELPKGPLRDAVVEGTGKPLRAGKQVMIRGGGGSLMATLPISVKAVSVESDSVRRGTLKDSGYTIVVAEKTPLKVPNRAQDSEVVFLPATYISVKLTSEVPRARYVDDATTLLGLIDAGISKVSSAAVTVKNLGAGDYAIDGTRVGTLVDTVEKLAEADIHADAALAFVRTIPAFQAKRAFLVASNNLEKLSSIFGPDMAGMPPEGMPPEGMPPEGTMAQQSPEINEPFMQSAAALGDQGVFDTAAVASLLQSPSLSEITSGYLPAMEKALDSLGRVLLALEMREATLRQELGKDEYSALENNIRRVFKGLGDIVMKLGQNTLAIGESQDAATTWGI